MRLKVFLFLMALVTFTGLNLANSTDSYAKMVSFDLISSFKGNNSDGTKFTTSPKFEVISGDANKIVDLANHYPHYHANVSQIKLKNGSMRVDYVANPAKLTVKFVDQDGNSIASDQLITQATFGGAYHLDGLKETDYQLIDPNQLEGKINDENEQIVLRYQSLKKDHQNHDANSHSSDSKSNSSATGNNGENKQPSDHQSHSKDEHLKPEPQPDKKSPDQQSKENSSTSHSSSADQVDKNKNQLHHGNSSDQQTVIPVIPNVINPTNAPIQNNNDDWVPLVNATLDYYHQLDQFMNGNLIEIPVKIKLPFQLHLRRNNFIKMRHHHLKPMKLIWKTIKS
ncbi:hypothetical protein WR164_11050 [Philodulcilactobacillus myokoensis]|uniref:MucBP domain-containing protein n=1 Tax=Philodulcilactobacillus myokoensis TaxID=2929573 RepID=A0A9W6B1M3_9LACO|nr:MucBP domain-containing protein [Philodulcilactobacillus myokoensis]GLB47126.1 hypothetical protein WR164_11050 [Philodulcilactobacillus myokoensis]